MSEEIITHTITIHRSELIPGGGGARIGYSDDYPDRQFLVIPEGASLPTLGDHLHKLGRIADGALRTIEQRKSSPHPSRNHAFWDGYRQCAEDIEDFARKHGYITP
jgi:hypothetical protein